MVQHIARRAAVAAVGLAFAAGVLGVSPPAASAATTTPSTATVAKASAMVAAVNSAHACRDIGNDGTTRAVFCADVIDDGNGYFTAQAEGMCQTIATGALVQCSDIFFEFSGWFKTYNVAAVDVDAGCGHPPYPLCLPARYIVHSQPVGQFDCNEEVWTVVWANGVNQITLPKTRQVKTLSNTDLGSGHIIIQQC